MRFLGKAKNTEDNVSREEKGCLGRAKKEEKAKATLWRHSSVLVVTMSPASVKSGPLPLRKLLFSSALPYLYTLTFSTG